MASLWGSCLRVFAAGRDLPAQCSPDTENAIPLNTSCPDGRSGFHIVTDGFILAFSGMGSQQIKASLDSVVRLVDLALFNQSVNGDPNRPTKLRATGTCSHENPTRVFLRRFSAMLRQSKGKFPLR